MVDVVVRRVIPGASNQTRDGWASVVTSAGLVYAHHEGVTYNCSTVVEGETPDLDEVLCSFSGTSVEAIKAAVDETGIPYVSIRVVRARLSPEDVEMAEA